MARMFEVVSQSAYLIVLKEIKSLEEAPDEFVSEEELADMGITHSYGGEFVMKAKVVDKINEYLGSIKEGQKSIVIDDQDLIDVLKDRTISDFVPNTRRVGNRLFKHEKAAKVRDKVTYNDWSRCVGLIEAYLWQIHHIRMDVKRSDSKRRPTMTMLKKMVEWDTLVDYRATHGRAYHITNVSDEDMVMMKMVYDNPDLAPEVNQEG